MEGKLRQRGGTEKGRGDRLREERGNGQRKWEMERQKNHGKRDVKEKEDSKQRQGEGVQRRMLAPAESCPQRSPIILAEIPPSSPRTEGKV